MQYIMQEPEWFLRKWIFKGNVFRNWITSLDGEWRLKCRCYAGFSELELKLSRRSRGDCRKRIENKYESYRLQLVRPVITKSTKLLKKRKATTSLPTPRNPPRTRAPQLFQANLAPLTDFAGARLYSTLPEFLSSCLPHRPLYVQLTPPREPRWPVILGQYPEHERWSYWGVAFGKRATSAIQLRPAMPNSWITRITNLVRTMLKHSC